MCQRLPELSLEKFFKVIIKICASYTNIKLILIIVPKSHIFVILIQLIGSTDL